jgi:hypothetical protein
MHSIIINNEVYAYPSSWKELNNRQLLKIAPLLLGTNENLIYRKAAVLFHFLPGLKRFWYLHPWVTALIKKFPKIAKKYPLLNEAQKWELLQTVNFLFTDISGTAILKSFIHNGIKYFLPGDNFTRESIIAFAFADEYFNAYVESGEMRFIDLLIGCIARQLGSALYPALQFAEGDTREHFSTSRTEQRAKEFKDLPDNIKTTILLYFMGSKKYIHKHYEIMFRKKEQDEIKEEVQTNEPQKRMKSFGKKKIPKPNFNWIGVIYELSETGVFGNFDQVKHMFVHTCCYYLAKKRYEKEEQSA